MSGTPRVELSNGRWRQGEAVVWRCAGTKCRHKVLGFVAGDKLLIRHMRREIEIGGCEEIRQVCDDCGTENTYPLGRDNPL